MVNAHTSRSSVAGPIGWTSATELECGSWIMRTMALGLTFRSVASTRRSWLSRGPEHDAVLAEGDRLR